MSLRTPGYLQLSFVLVSQLSISRAHGGTEEHLQLRHPWKPDVSLRTTGYLQLSFVLASQLSISRAHGGAEEHLQVQLREGPGSPVAASIPS